MGFFTNFKKLIASFSGPRIDETVRLPEDELRLVAIGNLYVYQQGGTLNTFHTGLDKSTIKEILSQWWGVKSREDARELIRYLAGAPSHEAMTYLTKAYELGEKEGKAYLVEHVPSIDMLNKAMSWIEHLRNSFDSLVKNGIISGAGDLLALSTLGWDAGRLNFIARISMDVGYITPDECRELLQYAYDMVKDRYGSWGEFGRSYVLGRAIYSGDTSMSALLEDLLTDAKSPWSYLVWR